MPRKSKFINPSEPQPVRVFKVSRYPAVAIPSHMARHLGVIEGLSIMEVHIEEGRLIYTPKPKGDFLTETVAVNQP